MIPKFRIFIKDTQFMDYDVVGIDFKREHAIVDTGWDIEEIRRFKDIILMRSTGLTDKNGKDIYEGDVLEIEGHPFQRHTGEMSGMPVGIDMDGRYAIEYNQENAGYVVGNWKTREVINYCTVIGNVHEHPELLGEPT